MELYNVTIVGDQSHILGNQYDNQTVSDVENILLSHWDEDYPKPKFDGTYQELNGDQSISITQII